MIDLKDLYGKKYMHKKRSMTKEECIKEYNKEMSTWQDKLYQLRRELLCDHDWEQVRLIYKKEPKCCGNVEILYRCKRCNKEITTTKAVKKVKLEDL